jgi:translation initiation factor IF-3
MAKKYYQTNQYIKVDSMRLVDDKGGQIGVVTKEQALAMAQEAGADLVMVAPNANPPVVKIIDFAKFKYQQKQKDSGSRKRAKSVGLKEIRFTPFIAQGDLNYRLKQAREFLEDGNKVKLNVKFTGRQITRKSFGENLLQKAVSELSDIATVEREAAWQGKILFTQLQPKK